MAARAMQFLTDSHSHRSMAGAAAHLPRAVLAALFLALAGRAGQFNAAVVDSQCCGGALPRSVAWRRSGCGQVLA